MKYSFKFLFYIASISLIAMIIFFSVWFIGRAVTGSWDIGEWNKIHKTSSSIVSEYNCQLSENTDNALLTTLEIINN